MDTRFGPVALVRWPDEWARLDDLRRCGAPRVLVVSSPHQPPSPVPVDEDWVRLPAPDADIQFRADVVAQRAVRQAVLPVATADGTVVFGDAWVAVPRLEAVLAGVLIDAFGTPVSHAELCRAGWPDAEPAADAIRTPIRKLRRRLAGIGLDVRSVRGYGYVLEPAGGRARDDGRARLAGLVTAPVIDHGRLCFGQRWVALSDTELRLASALASQCGAVVDTSTLIDAAWADGGGSPTALRVQMMRLRRRIADLGLVITTVRSHGYVLEASTRLVDTA